MIWSVNPIPDPRSSPGPLRPTPSVLPPVVVGADIGGTTTRVAVADLTGTVLAVASGAAGNPAGVGLATSIERIGTTVRDALAMAGVRAGGRVRAVRATLGLAGVTTLVRSGDAERFTAAVLPDVPTRLVSDFAVAFSSATPARHGVVTIAGTGSGALEVCDGIEVARRDAWGWLLGDDGSGQWLGREAVRATLRQLDAGLEPGPLAREVLAALGARTAAEVVAACYRREPRQLSELARAVGATTGRDPVADAVVARGADLVAARLVDLVGGREDLPVVLAGSLVTGDGPLADRVRAALSAAGATNVYEAGDGLGGALWLALRDPEQDTSGPAVRWSELLGSLDVCRSGSSVPCES